jgi:hypothetical protein
MDAQPASAIPQHPAPRFKFLLILLGVLFLVPHASYGQTDPCDPVPSQCITRCSPQGWGIQVTIHHKSFECFQFFRQRCGESGWTLFYTGPDSSICDCAYNPSYKYRYHVNRFWDLTYGTCMSFSDSCTSLWWTDDGEITSCP